MFSVAKCSSERPVPPLWPEQSTESIYQFSADWTGAIMIRLRGFVDKWFLLVAREHLTFYFFSEQIRCLFFFCFLSGSPAFIISLSYQTFEVLSKVWTYDHSGVLASVKMVPARLHNIWKWITSEYVVFRMKIVIQLWIYLISFEITRVLWDNCGNKRSSLAVKKFEKLFD